MIFWRQSLFRFSRHLLADMLIFLTRCSIFFFVCRRLFGASPALGSAAEGTPPIEYINHTQ